MKQESVNISNGLNKTRLFILLGILFVSVVLLLAVKSSPLLYQYLITAPLSPGDTIVNQATATYQDTSGSPYGPVSSNQVQTTIVGTSGGTFTFTHTREAKSIFSGNVTIRVYGAGTANLVATLTPTTDNSGQATVNTTALVNSQRYDFVLKVPYHLTKKLTNVQWPPAVVLNFGQVTASDLNNDDAINSVDWSVMNAQWRTAGPAADINQDTIVNTVDWGVMNKNWGVVGEE